MSKRDAAVLLRVTGTTALRRCGSLPRLCGVAVGRAVFGRVGSTAWAVRLRGRVLLTSSSAPLAASCSFTGGPMCLPGDTVGPMDADWFVCHVVVGCSTAPLASVVRRLAASACGLVIGLMVSTTMW